MAKKSSSTGYWRGPVARSLVIIGSFLLVFALVAVWLHSEFLDTDNYVETMDSLLTNEAIVNDLADAITNQVFEQIDTPKVIQDRLPDRMQFLAVPLAVELRNFATNEMRKLIGSDEFHRIWVEANRALHSRMVKFLRGESDLVFLSDDEVVLDLGVIATRLRTRLEAAGIDLFKNVKLENVETRVVLFDAPALKRLQSFVLLLDRLFVVLPFMVMSCFFLGLTFSPRRLSTIQEIGIGIAISMIFLGFALPLCRSWYLDSVKGGNLSPEAAAVLFDTITLSLRDAVFFLFLIGFAIAVIAAVFRHKTRRSIVIPG